MFFALDPLGDTRNGSVSIYAYNVSYANASLTAGELRVTVVSPSGSSVAFLLVLVTGSGGNAIATYNATQGQWTSGSGAVIFAGMHFSVTSQTSLVGDLLEVSSGSGAGYWIVATRIG